MDDDTKPTINTTPPPATTTSTTPNAAANAPSDPNGSATTATGKRYRAAPAKTFACRGYGECRMVFSRSEHLARHVRKHTGERPFQCHCGKQFSRLDNLRQHAQTVHADKQEQNERMMRDLTSLHTSMSAGAKRDARKKAAAAQAIGAVNPGLPTHPSLHHPSLMQQHSMVQSPIGMAPGYPSPTGPGMPAHIPGHMHAQSMSAAIGHTPGYHDAVSGRYGRGRPGTSAGYEGGFDPHSAYDPRRWPHAGPPPGPGAQHPSLGGWHGDAAVAGFGTSSPTTAHHPHPASNTSHPYPTPDESGAGFREGGFHRPPVPVAAPAQAQSQTTTSSSSTSQQQQAQGSQAGPAAQGQAHPGQSTQDQQAQALGFRDGSGLGFRQQHQQHNPNTPNNSSSSSGQAGFGLNSSSSNSSSGLASSTQQPSSADLTGMQTEQGFRDTGGTSSSFRGGSFRGDAGAGGSYGRDAPRYDDDDDDERDEARGDRAGGDDRMDTDVSPSAADEPLHGRHRDEYDDESRPGAQGSYSFRRESADDARFARRPPPDRRYARSATPDSPAPRDAPQPRAFAESQPGRYEQSRYSAAGARAEYERAPGAAYYAEREREYGPPAAARGERDGYGERYGYGYDRYGYRDAYGYAERPTSSYQRGGESPPSSTSSAGTATYYARERERERSPPRRTGTASGVLLPDAFAFAGRPGTAPAAYASGYGGGGLGRLSAITRGAAAAAAEPSSPTGYNDSPFSFHPPGLGSSTTPSSGSYATTTPATSSQSTASATSLHANALAGPGVSGASSSRKRAAPDSDFDAVERTRPGTGYQQQQQRPTTGSASRPQSRRLSVMELCNDEDARPPTSGGGGERAGFARTQRLLPVSSSRPGTSSGGDGHLVSFFRRPDTSSGRDYGYGGGGRPGSSGSSPFAFAHPGDVAAVRLSPDAPATTAAGTGDATGDSSGSSTPGAGTGRRILRSPSGSGGKSKSLTPRASASVSPVLSAGAGASPPLSAARAEGIVGVAKGSPGVRV